MSLSIVTTSVTIPFAKKSTIARKGIWVYIRVINIFLVARFTIYYTESVIYIMSLNIIRETTTTITKFNGV